MIRHGTRCTEEHKLPRYWVLDGNNTYHGMACSNTQILQQPDTPARSTPFDSTNRPILQNR